MIGLGYCKSSSFVPGSGSNPSGEKVASGRTSLLSIVVHVKGLTSSGDTAHSIVLENGDTDGEVRYQAQPFATTPTIVTNLNLLISQVVMGELGILFEEGIWAEFAETGDTNGVDNITFFYI